MLQEMATITSKRQMTIPVAIFRKLHLEEKEKVFVTEEDGIIKIIPALSLLDKLAGSVKVPKRFRGLSSTEMIKKAKEDYFRRKYKKNGIR